jgi:hypothetical protein
MQRAGVQPMPSCKALWAGVVVAFSLTALTGCDAEPEDVTFLAVGSQPETRDLDRGTYRSSNPAVLSILDMRDITDSGCAGITLVGCPGKEITIHRTDITFQAVAEGDASIEGKTEEGEDISLDFRVERVTGIKVREVVSPMDNNSALVAVPNDQTLVLSSGGSLLLQIHLMGKSQEALGYIESFAASSNDEAVVTLESFVYSYGYRVRLDGLEPGATSVVISTPTVDRTLQIQVE